MFNKFKGVQFMVHSKKNSGGNRKGEKKSHPHLSQKNKVIAVLLIILAISALGSWWLMRDDSSQNGDYPPNIDRSITFPKDEGRHNESMELWSVNFHLSTGSGKNYRVYIRYANIGVLLMKGMSLVIHSTQNQQKGHSTVNTGD
jgi:hypothetical protein